LWQTDRCRVIANTVPAPCHDGKNLRHSSPKCIF